MGPRSVAVSVAALLMFACGSSAPAPEPVPVDALPGEAGDAVPLDAATVAADAIDFAGLETLLGEAGFVGGSQRTFAQLDGGRRRALARILVFDHAEGARGYLGWLEDHVAEVIGDAQPLETPNLPGAGFSAVSEPNACCPNSTRVFFAAWSDGATVLTLEVGGDGVRPERVGELASMLDDAV